MIRPRCVILEKYNFMENWVPIVLIYEGLYNMEKLRRDCSYYQPTVDIIKTFSRCNDFFMFSMTAQ